MPNLKERVEAGVKLLDREEPDWRSRIKALDMESLTLCVLGQLYGHYRDGVVALYDDGDTLEGDIWAEAHGFYLIGGSCAEYDLLTEAWFEALNGH